MKESQPKNENEYLEYLKNEYEKHIYNENKNQSYISYIYYIEEVFNRDIIVKKRNSTAFYLSDFIAQEWKYFCETIPGKSKSELLEKALICFMLGYPDKNKNLLINIDINAKRSEVDNIQKERKESLLCLRLNDIINKIISYQEKDIMDKYPMVFKIFLELMDEAVTINDPSPELVELLKRSRLVL